MKCPQCASPLEGSRTVCEECGGMFVTEHELNEMLAAIASPGSAGARSNAEGVAESIDTTRYPRDRRTLDDWHGTEPSDRRCPLCSHAMVRVEMERVPVERASVTACGSTRAS